ncbi:hypothetical protein M899_0261 [Bacteriovorax sp. BSW11_IV]|uniref:hypothetical protein n=1 Tax=Bacteriovorax sp. BSW11_IV TaxID=1353529 RepID=UPI00038A0789|nr:hypothetical protein [Bacteriovorax sp. BSW11_IV]EQC47649.1 hypothetical protein M899_0261 [Bacteriovorax sp. BSW11_IV]
MTKTAITISQRGHELLKKYQLLKNEFNSSSHATYGQYEDEFITITAKWDNSLFLRELYFDFKDLEPIQELIAVALRVLVLDQNYARLNGLSVREIDNFLRDEPMTSFLVIEEAEALEHWLGLVKQKIMASFFQLKSIESFSFTDSTLVHKVHFFGHAFSELNKILPSLELELVHIHDETVVFSHGQEVHSFILTSALKAVEGKISNDKGHFPINWVAQ